MTSAGSRAILWPANIRRSSRTRRGWRPRAALRGSPHERRIVPAAGVRTAIRGTGDPGFVELPAQRLADRVREDRLVGRGVEREQPPLLARGDGRIARPAQGIRGQALQVALFGDVARPRLRRVEHVLVEFRLGRGQPFHHFAETLLAVGRQRDACQAKIAQGVLHDLALLRTEARALAVRHRLVGRTELRVLASSCGRR